MQCVVKSTSQIKGKKKEKKKERTMRIIVARSHSGLMSAPLMLACLFPLPNHAAASAAHCIPTKEGSASRRGSPCLSSPALFPFVLAVSPPLLAAHAK